MAQLLKYQQILLFVAQVFYSLPLTSEYSVARFCKILPLWPKFKSLGQLCKG